MDHYHAGQKWSCESTQKRLIAVESERDKLKAELEQVKTHHRYDLEQFRKCQDERDAWKEMAGEMAEALETIVANPISACSERHDIIAQMALASYEAMKEKA